MKIAEIELKMQTDGFTEELFDNFKVALRRVPKDLRSQHCYCTVLNFQDEDFENAIRLIEYGMENCENSWLNFMLSYRNMGLIFERRKDFANATECFEKALESVKEEHKESYSPSLSMDILRCKLHRDDFSYSPYLEKLYLNVLKADGFQSTFRSFNFYRSLASIIVAQHYGDEESVKSARDVALATLDGERRTTMDIILSRHRFKDEAKATDEAIRFLSNIKGR